MAALEKLRKLLMTAGTLAKTTERFDRLMKKVSWKPYHFMNQLKSTSIKCFVLDARPKFVKKSEIRITDV